ncbi:MAG: glycosyltransferase [Verrucomicrobia bacterium]|nr:glycosyltransferase [Verrucomicrobiota bacterium]
MRVLIATVTAGAGHLQAAAALEEIWHASRPHDVVEKVDLLSFVSKLHKKVYAEGYVKLVEHAPELWGMVFRQTDNARLVRKLTKLRRGWAKVTNPRFVKHLRRFKPEVVICTHYLPVEVLGALEGKRADFDPLVVCVVTDFEAHALWMDQAVDLYCVAAEETKARLVARGAKAEQVLVTGIPIAQKFSSRPDARAVRKTLGLRDDLATLLVLSGGFGMGPVAEILGALDQVEAAFQTLVVAGRNEELRRDLAARDHRHPTRVLGFVANMHELMVVADLIVTKPGGLTSSEALALGKPLFILNPIPGQEAANSDFLLERGAAAKVNRVDDLAFRIAQLLGSPKLKEMARAAKVLGRPNAAADICRAVTERLTAAVRGQST